MSFNNFSFCPRNITSLLPSVSLFTCDGSITIFISIAYVFCTPIFEPKAARPTHSHFTIKQFQHFEFFKNINRSVHALQNRLSGQQSSAISQLMHVTVVSDVSTSISWRHCDDDHLKSSTPGAATSRTSHGRRATTGYFWPKQVHAHRLCNPLEHSSGRYVRLKVRLTKWHHRKFLRRGHFELFQIVADQVGSQRKSTTGGPIEA